MSEKFENEKVIQKFLLGELPEQREHPIVTVCNRGNLSISGMLVLQSLGYRNVRSLNGGTIAWAEQGLPTNG